MKPGFLTLTLSSVGLLSSLSAQTPTPNILYIFTDQQAAMAMSCAGNNDLKTPSMDRLAREGVRFINAYCAFPLCTPSRATMFTGYHPHQTGITRNGMPIPDGYINKTLGHVLSAAGYHCAYGGKWHLPGSTMDDAHGFTKIHNFGDKGLAESCVEFLKQKHSKPFFLVASFDNPHNICEYARKQPLPWAEVEEPHPSDLPNLPINFKGSAFEPDIIRMEQKKDFSLYPTIYYDEEDWRRYRNAYYRLIEEVDKEIGKILDVLFQQGLDKNTIVIFSSDHGDGNAAHRWNQKSVLFEEVINIPLIVRLPGGINAGKEIFHLVSNGTDLFRSICDWAGIKPSADLPGKSFRQLATGKSSDALHEYLVVETLFDRSDTRGWALRTEGYKYVMYSSGRNREQLFDMEKDRLEMVNLAIEGRYSEILEQHRSLFREWAVKVNDKSVLKIIP